MIIVNKIGLNDRESVMIIKEVLSLISEGNKLTNDLFLNKWLEAAPGVIGSMYTAVREYPATHIEKIMQASNYTEELLNEFLTLVNKGYVEFDQAQLDSINQLHIRYKESKWFQKFRNASRDDTKKLKERLSSDESQLDKAKAIFKHMKSKDTDFAVVLMDFFLAGKLFKPSEAFKSLHAKITVIVKRDISIETFFKGMIHGIKKAKDLFDKIENNEAESDGELITSYHQDHMTEFKYDHELEKLKQDNQQALKRVEIEQAHKLMMLVKEQEFELKKEIIIKEYSDKKAAIKAANTKDNANGKENAQGAQADHKGVVKIITAQRKGLTKSQDPENPVTQSDLT